MPMTALIDADSIVYILAWHHKDLEEDLYGADVVKSACDQMITSMLSSCRATHYLGSFSSPGETFRHRHYKFAPYKGTRKEKDDWVKRWETVIKKHLCEKWGFFIPLSDLEADDVVSGIACMIPDTEYVICSPDKDLKQISGWYFDYKKGEGVSCIEPLEAAKYYYCQMLTGDSTDNIKGIPGLGDVKVKALLNLAADAVEMAAIVEAQYIKYFGAYYGKIIHQENVIAVQLLRPGHPLWEEYKNYLEGIYHMHIKTIAVSEEEKVFNMES